MATKRLTREVVLEAGVALADADGIDALTMRKLAAALGVEAMSLYNHVENKADLIGGMVDLVVSEIRLPTRTERWDAAVRDCAVSAHQTFLRHPWACSLVMSSGPPRIEGSARLGYMDWLLGRLREAGFSPELTYHAYHALDGHILGFTLWQLGHAAAVTALSGNSDFADFAAAFVPKLRDAGLAHLAEHAEQHAAPPAANGASEFEFGLDLILDGLERAREAG